MLSQTNKCPTPRGSSSFDSNTWTNSFGSRDSRTRTSRVKADRSYWEGHYLEYPSNDEANLPIWAVWSEDRVIGQTAALPVELKVGRAGRGRRFSQWNMREHTVEQRIESYAEFWPFYVREHSKPLTRALHFAGTSLGVALLIYFIATGRWYLLPVFLVIGYAFAWFAHFAVEKNRPATFKYPLWSFVSDFRMMWFIVTGRMGREVEKAEAVGNHIGA